MKTRDHPNYEKINQFVEKLNSNDSPIIRIVILDLMGVTKYSVTSFEDIEPNREGCFVIPRIGDTISKIEILGENDISFNLLKMGLNKVQIESNNFNKIINFENQLPLIALCEDIKIGSKNCSKNCSKIKSLV